jgi:hypothetical protein
MVRLCVIAVCLFFTLSLVFAQGLVGQKAPQIKASGWMNTEPLTPEKLKGKVVLLEFWTTR